MLPDVNVFPLMPFPSTERIVQKVIPPPTKAGSFRKKQTVLAINPAQIAFAKCGAITN